MTLLAHLKDVADSGAIWRDAAGTAIVEQNSWAVGSTDSFGVVPVGWYRYALNSPNPAKCQMSITPEGYLRLEYESEGNNERFGISFNSGLSGGEAGVTSWRYRILERVGVSPYIGSAGNSLQLNRDDMSVGSWITAEQADVAGGNNGFIAHAYGASSGDRIVAEIDFIRAYEENAATLQGTTLDVAKTAGPGGEVTDAVTFSGTGSGGVLPVLGAATPYTFAAWYRSDGSSGEVIYCAEDADNDGARLIVLGGGTPRASYELQDQQGTSDIDDGQWHHVACTHSGTTLEIFIDGQSEGSRPSLDASFNVTTASTIGKNSYADTGLLSGDLADLRVYDSDESANIADIYAEGVTSATCSIVAPPNRAGDTLTAVASTNNPTASLLIEWIRADDSSGTNAEVIPGATGINYTTTDFDRGFWVAARATATGANDSAVATSSYVRVPVGLVFHLDEVPASGTEWANSGAAGGVATLNGAASFADVRVDGPGGAVQSAVDFDGAAQYLQGPTLTSPTAYTLAFWGKPAAGATQVAIGWRDGATDGISLLVESDGDVRLTHDTAGNIAGVGAPDVTDGDWHHMAATWDGANVRVFVDGQIYREIPVTTSLSIDTALRIGAVAYAASAFYDGQIADPRVYDRALTASEIRSLWAIGVATEGNRFNVPRSAVRSIIQSTVT